MKPRIDVVYEGAYTPLDQWKALQVVTKRIALASTLLVPASATGRAVTVWGARQAAVRFGTAIQAIISDPVAQHMRLQRLLKTYKSGADAVHAYKYFNKMRNYKSSGSSSRAYQQNGSPGGTRPSKKKGPDSYDIPQEGYRKVSGSRGPCEFGYKLRKVRGRWMCVRWM